MYLRRRLECGDEDIVGWALCLEAAMRNVLNLHQRREGHVTSDMRD